MAETYYIRLPFYLLMASANRSVDITFDGTLISTAEISAISRDSMDNVTFSVTKDPGTYLLKVKPVAATETDFGLTTVCLDDVWVSNNNTNFYSVLLNYNKDLKKINKTPVDPLYGFNPATGASLYNDAEFTLEVILPDAANFDKVYSAADLSVMKKVIADYEANILDDPDGILTPELYNLIKLSLELYIARGYN